MSLALYIMERAYGWARVPVLTLPLLSQVILGKSFHPSKP